MPIDPTQEIIITEWDEPSRPASILKNSQVAQLIGASFLGGIGLGVLGYFLKESTLYFAAATVVVAGIAYAVQQRRPGTFSHIRLTNVRLSIGEKEYPLGDIAGFWLDRDGDLIVVNIERVKSTMFPITFLAASSSGEQTREQLLQILPEVEPRPASSFNQLFRR